MPISMERNYNTENVSYPHIVPYGRKKGTCTTILNDTYSGNRYHKKGKICSYTQTDTLRGFANEQAAQHDRLTNLGSENLTFTVVENYANNENFKSTSIIGDKKIQILNKNGVERIRECSAETGYKWRLVSYKSPEIEYAAKDFVKYLDGDEYEFRLVKKHLDLNKGLDLKGRLESLFTDYMERMPTTTNYYEHAWVNQEFDLRYLTKNEKAMLNGEIAKQGKQFAKKLMAFAEILLKR